MSCTLISIDNTEDSTVEFKDLQRGTCFLYGGNLYMKMNDCTVIHSSSKSTNFSEWDKLPYCELRKKVFNAVVLYYQHSDSQGRSYIQHSSNNQGQRGCFKESTKVKVVSRIKISFFTILKIYINNTYIIPLNFC